MTKQELSGKGLSRVEIATAAVSRCETKLAAAQERLKTAKAADKAGTAKRAAKAATKRERAAKLLRDLGKTDAEIAKILG